MVKIIRNESNLYLINYDKANELIVQSQEDINIAEENIYRIKRRRQRDSFI
jgi:hypothetical protein